MPVAIGYESDYGSDIDEDTVAGLIAQEWAETSRPLIIEPIDAVNPLPKVVRIPRAVGSSPDTRHKRKRVTASDDADLLDMASLVDTTAASLLAATGIANAQDNVTAREQKPTNAQVAELAVEEDADDPRSPLQRFREQRKRPMSVTDLVSPAWCELQYLYNLTKYGRVQQTPAMRQGSTVHKALEEEVHIEVPVEIMTRADGFGLRIWNVIQGLRTLRATGMTRELEVWGFAGGILVNGVIDMVSYTNPDPEFKLPLPLQPPGRPGWYTDRNFRLSYMHPQKHKHKHKKQVYITDVKTRSSSSVPKDKVALRPTYMQLMLYKTLLDQLASESLSDAVFERYQINGDEVFSDVFISQIAGADQRNPASSTDRSLRSTSRKEADNLSQLTEHNTPSTLWQLMRSEAEGAFSNISPLLRAEYRTASTGAVLGEKLFLWEPLLLDGHLRKVLAWWKGERPAQGVEIEEAFKCRLCAFADGCNWRKEKEDESIKAARLKRTAL